MSEKKHNLYLIGMPGAGKSTIGRALAKCLQLKFVDADHALTEKTGVSIATIFEMEGEEGFRIRENALLAELSMRTGLLVATGGGIVLREDNRAIMHRTGVVVYLRAKIDDLWARTQHDSKRPLLRAENPRAVLTNLLELREPLYATLADLIVETAGYPKVTRLAQDIADRLMQNQLWNALPQSSTTNTT
ncbi:MAG: shikimate kinase [Usitatibacteraceae bacterium]